MTRTEEAIILAGGLGTRLRAVVSEVPKPLAPVAGRPFLALLLERLAERGIRRVILATGHLAQQVEATFGRRWASMEVVYSVEHEPLGTGGALRQAISALTGSAVHVMNGDTWLDFDPFALERFAASAGKPLAMALAHVQDVSRYGAVEVRGGVVEAFREKGETGPGWINAGCYFLTADALSALPQRTAYSFESDVLRPRAMSRDVAAFTETRGFIDIGVPEDYFRAQSLFAACK